MLASLKAECRKLLTVRSTYFIIAFVLALVVFFAFYVEGIKANGIVHHGGVAMLNDPHKLASEVTGAIGAVSLFGALAGVLLMTHEYRYNTIMYTLTASRSRSKTLLAKVLTVSAFAAVFTLIIAAFSPSMTLLGLHLKHVQLIHQDFQFWHLGLRALFYGWGFSMAGLLFAVLMRNQIAAIVTLFFLPTTIEAILGLLLKKNAVYLPFGALNAVLQDKPEVGTLSHAHAAMVFAAYLVVGWIVAWILFVRRDAN